MQLKRLVIKTLLLNDMSAIHTATLLLATLLSSVAAAGNTINIELNKVEQRNKNCRTYLVADNNTRLAIDILRLDLVLFDSNEIIIRNMALNIAPLASAKKSVKAFDLKNTACNNIGSMLVNSVLECKSKNNTAVDCLALLRLSSKTSISLVK